MAGSENYGGGTFGAEAARLVEDRARAKNWKRWGPYLSERQWGTVREDYSPDGAAWHYFTHDQARSRAYRWGEDGLLGFTDRECRLCFALALWNGKDAILKERLFGLAGPEGNHGEDCKELYYYLDSSPTHSYMKAMYKYPMRAYPYADLVQTNGHRSREEDEYELEDTGVLADGHWDVVAEYGKHDDNDIVIRISLTNRSAAQAEIDVLPTLWFRNTWIWGCHHEGCTMKPTIRTAPGGTGYAEVITKHDTLEPFHLYAFPASGGAVAPGSDSVPDWWFTENETNTNRLFNVDNYTPYTKDAFHRRLINGEEGATSPKPQGTKCAARYHLVVPAGGTAVIRMRLRGSTEPAEIGDAATIDAILAARLRETNDYYAARQPPDLSPAELLVQRQAFAGLLWTKQFYHYVAQDWLVGDPYMPTPPPERLHGRNHEWTHMFCRDVLSMPDKWEYPWFAAWDLAFHMIPLSRIDPDFAKQQLLLLLREWYMHANGQLPAYEYAFDDVNPPVHAWAVWRVYKISDVRGQRDVKFLARCFLKLNINFTWWVNRKDAEGKNLFGGGFLGLDNIGVFDRSKPLPTGGMLDQADGTSWMAFYCVIMLEIAIELAKYYDTAFEDIASKYFEHFVQIADATNGFGTGRGLWDDADGCYFDRISFPDGSSEFLKVISMVTIIPLFATLVLDQETLDALPAFTKRMKWFLQYRPDLAQCVSLMAPRTADADECKSEDPRRYLLAIPSRERLVRVLQRLLDPAEFLSDYGIRSLSRTHEHSPYVFTRDGKSYDVTYNPGESRSAIFGGNSNWRGPIWLPCNWLLVEALVRYHYFFGDDLRVECPVGSGTTMNLKEVAAFLSERMTKLFLPDASGRRPCMGPSAPLYDQPGWEDLVLFYEYFDPETGRGCGASHQTGWTALVARCFDLLAADRAAAREGEPSGPDVADVVLDGERGKTPDERRHARAAESPGGATVDDVTTSDPAQRRPPGQ
eukprot:m.35596 g.35596  ORF g.35596 m.35596 type:complete len:977 (-) comp5342_c0_seq2:278-3208(-)